MRVTPFKFTSSSKAEIINNLSVAIENKEIWLPNDPQVIDELELYEYSVSKSGNVTYSAPEGFHDDIVMALCLAWSAVKTTIHFQSFNRSKFGL